MWGVFVLISDRRELHSFLANVSSRIRVPRWSLSKPHLKGSRGGVSLGVELMRHRARELLAGLRTSVLNALCGHLPDFFRPNRLACKSRRMAQEIKCAL
jgi:hypothetical protein